MRENIRAGHPALPDGDGMDEPGATFRSLPVGPFVAWAIKSVVLKYGGPALCNSTRPFFLGLTMGQSFISGMWLVIDYFTGMVGNQPIGGLFV